MHLGLDGQTDVLRSHSARVIHWSKLWLLLVYFMIQVASYRSIRALASPVVEEGFYSGTSLSWMVSVPVA